MLNVMQTEKHIFFNKYNENVWMKKYRFHSGVLNGLLINQRVNECSGYLWFHMGSRVF